MKKSGLVALLAVVILAIALFSGCSSSDSKDAGEELPTVVIGTMATEDILPGWVALDSGYFEEEGVNVSIEVFDSAPALSAAITSGQVDMAMTDVMRAAKLYESGIDVVAEWITLGQNADEGRFGILAPADSSYNNLSELAEYVAASQLSEGNGVGVAANTVPEYALDRLMDEQGIPAQSIPTVEIASLPERYGLVASGKIIAAALPNSLLTLGQANGLKVIAEDTHGQNISMSIMVARADFAKDDQNAIEQIAKAWDKAVSQINDAPDDYISVLMEYANLNSDTAEIYKVSHYPSALVDGKIAHPSSSDMEAQIDWMEAKGYISSSITYDEATGSFRRE